MGIPGARQHQSATLSKPIIETYSNIGVCNSPELKKIVFKHAANRDSNRESIAFQTQGKEAVARMPFSMRENLPNILEDVEKSKKRGVISSYGLAVANLEEVFLKIADADVDEDKIRSSQETSESS